jgi:hypothetical protein
LRKLKIESEIEIEEFIDASKLEGVLKIVISKVFFIEAKVNYVIVREISDDKTSPST